jgi:hypothetical protein
MRGLIFFIVFIGALCFPSCSACLGKLDQDKKKARVTNDVE